MKELPLRSHALNIERIRDGDIIKYRYQHSPVFTDLKECVQWIKDHLGELENASERG